MSEFDFAPFSPSLDVPMVDGCLTHSVGPYAHNRSELMSTITSSSKKPLEYPFSPSHRAIFKPITTFDDEASTAETVPFSSSYTSNNNKTNNNTFPVCTPHTPSRVLSTSEVGQNLSFGKCRTEYCEVELRDNMSAPSSIRHDYATHYKDEKQITFLSSSDKFSTLIATPKHQGELRTSHEFADPFHHQTDTIEGNLDTFFEKINRMQQEAGERKIHVDAKTAEVKELEEKKARLTAQLSQATSMLGQNKAKADHEKLVLQREWSEALAAVNRSKAVLTANVDHLKVMISCNGAAPSDSRPTSDASMNKKDGFMFDDTFVPFELYHSIFSIIIQYVMPVLEIDELLEHLERSSISHNKESRDISFVQPRALHLSLASQNSQISLPIPDNILSKDKPTGKVYHHLPESVIRSIIAFILLRFREGIADGKTPPNPTTASNSLHVMPSWDSEAFKSYHLCRESVKNSLLVEKRNFSAVFGDNVLEDELGAASEENTVSGTVSVTHEDQPAATTNKRDRSGSQMYEREYAPNIFPRGTEGSHLVKIIDKELRENTVCMMSDPVLDPNGPSVSILFNLIKFGILRKSLILRASCDFSNKS